LIEKQEESIVLLVYKAFLERP